MSVKYKYGESTSAISRYKALQKSHHVWISMKMSQCHCSKMIFSVSAV